MSKQPATEADLLERKATTAMQQFQERRGYYILVGIGLLLVAVAAIVVANLPETQEEGAFARMWAKAQPILARYRVDLSARDLLDGENGFDAYVAKLKGDHIEGYGLWFLSLFRHREAWTPDKLTTAERVVQLEQAEAHLLTLGEERFDDLLIAKNGWFLAGLDNLVDMQLKNVEGDLKWATEHDYAPPAPATDRVAVVRTEIGDIYLNFFPDLAPKHVHNFIRLAKLGAYNGTVFHFLEREPGRPEVVSGISGGDPYSFFYPDPLKKDHILRWGSGGVGYAVPSEAARFKVLHRPGVVTSLLQTGRPRRADWDNGAQFHVVLEPSPNLDRKHTPFAVVSEGMDVARKIAERKTAAEHDAYRSDPAFSRLETRDLVVEPVRIDKVLVYRNGVLDEEGDPHAFVVADTERKLADLKGNPVKPLKGKELYAKRKLRSTSADTAYVRGRAVPFPFDVDMTPVHAYGERTDAPPLSEREDVDEDKNAGDAEDAGGADDAGAGEGAGKPAGCGCGCGGD